MKIEERINDVVRQCIPPDESVQHLYRVYGKPFDAIKTPVQTQIMVQLKFAINRWM